ncbi:hypothetical protein [Gemmatimonas sp.]|jgi:hypothetical protein
MTDSVIQTQANVHRSSITDRSALTDGTTVPFVPQHGVRNQM